MPSNIYGTGHFLEKTTLAIKFEYYIYLRILKMENKATKGQKVEEVYPFDADLEDDTIAAYNKFLQVCRDNGDSISMKLFEQIIDEEQAHFNYFDSVADHIKELGAVYLAQMAGSSSATGLQPQ